MLGNYINDITIKNALRNILQNYQNRKLMVNEFWKHLQSTNIPINVTEFVNTWISQPGYPIINVSKFKQTIILTQQKFEPRKNMEIKTKWVQKLLNSEVFQVSSV